MKVEKLNCCTEMSNMFEPVQKKCHHYFLYLFANYVGSAKEMKEILTLHLLQFKGCFIMDVLYIILKVKEYAKINVCKPHSADVMPVTYIYSFPFSPLNI